MVHEIAPETKKRLAKGLGELQKSPEWEVIQRSIDQSILHAASTLGSRSEMSPSEVDFRRGVIFAFDQLKKMPEMVAAQLLNDATLALAFHEQKGEEQ